MGIPKLLATVTPFGERQPLIDEQIVVDGPGLAYYAVGLCQEDREGICWDSHPFDRPTPSQLGQTVVAWLDVLRKCGNTISALYFDGYLPEAKRPTRLGRVYRTSADFSEVFASYQPKMPDFDTAKLHKTSRPPVPSFAVPAVLDVLRQHPHYGPLTHLVPGEADPYCADHVRNNGGGVVLTADSDLVVHDLGPDGKVVFFREVDLKKAAAADDGAALVVPMYSPVSICRRLSLDPAGGLLAFAFELFMDAHLSVNELAERARKRAAISLYPQEYAEFVGPYGWAEELVADVPGTYDLNGLDPRVSETVLQCLLRPAGTGTQQSDLLFFNPPLLESSMRSSAWDVSASVRSCAFGLAQILASRRISAMRQYTRVSSPASRGSQLELPPVSRLDDTVGHLTSLLDRIQKRISDTELQWIVLSSCQDIAWASEHGKESTCLTVMRKETSAGGVVEHLTWNATHWLAQIQGTLYSLRILQQVADFVSREADKSQLEQMPVQLPELRTMLSALPPLVAYPDLRSLQRLPAKLKEAGALELLAELTGLPEAIRFRPKSKDKKRKRAGQQAAAASSARQSTNPFAVLDNVG